MTLTKRFSRSRNRSLSRIANSFIDSFSPNASAFFRRIFRSLRLVGHAPDYISDLLTPVADIPTRSSLRASSNGNLFLPRTEQRFGDRAFSVAAPRVWNRLPTELKLMRSSTTTFKRHLKTILFNSAHFSH